MKPHRFCLCILLLSQPNFDRCCHRRLSVNRLCVCVLMLMLNEHKQKPVLQRNVTTAAKSLINIYSKYVFLVLSLLVNRQSGRQSSFAILWNWYPITANSYPQQFPRSLIIVIFAKIVDAVLYASARSYKHCCAACCVLRALFVDQLIYSNEDSWESFFFSALSETIFLQISLNKLFDFKFLLSA